MEGNFVYRFVGEGGEILYIGRTKNLKNRIRQHFNGGHLEKECYDKTISIHYLEFESESDMFFMEIYLINKYKPKYNSKDLSLEKSKISIDYKEEWKLYEGVEGLTKQYKLDWILNNFELIFDMVEDYKNIGNLTRSNSIISIQLPATVNSEVRKTFRVNDVVLDKFDTFCKLHPEFTVKDLISQAMLDFINKYGQGEI